MPKTALTRFSTHEEGGHSNGRWVSAEHHGRWVSAELYGIDLS